MDLFARLPAPVVAPSPEAWWASGAAFNPGADLAPDGTLRLVVRGVPAGYHHVETPRTASGQPGFPYRDYVSHLGLATRQPDGSFALDAEPFLSPASEVDQWGVEDARVTRLNGTIYLTYTALAEPAYAADAGVGIALASTDWTTVERFGRIGPPSRDKDAVLFPELVGGKVAMLHRVEPDIQVAYFEDEGQLRKPGASYWERHLAHLDRHTLLRPEQPWEGAKIGAGPPPILTDEGWLLVTHGVDADHVYRAGLVLLDRDTLQVIARTRGPVFEPRLAFEREGDIPNVVFPTGAVVENGDLTLFYGAADSCVGQASAPLADVLARLHEDRSDGPPPRVLGPPAVAVARLHGGRPILEPVADHPWESGVVLNPAAVLVDDPAEVAALAEAWGLDPDERAMLAEGACVMVYRAQGTAHPRETPAGPLAASSLGLAVFTPDLRLVRRWPAPVIAPEAPFHDLGVEDPRCTRVGDTYYLHYTGYTSTDRAPGAAGRVHLCLATTTDFLTWDLRGPLASGGASLGVNAVDDKNGALFPEPVGGDWYLWHRPMAGPGAMAMHLASAPSPDGPWRSRGAVLASDRFAGWASSWVGAAGPPIALGGGQFLALTHHGHRDAAGQRFYHLSAALVEPAADAPVRARLAPLLLPEGDAERRGDPSLGVDDVVFSCAAFVVGDRLVVPYAGADSRIFGASTPLAPLVAALERRAGG